MKITYIEESDSAILDAELPLEDYREPITGEYVEEHDAVIHTDRNGKLRSVEILSGASESLSIPLLTLFGIVEHKRGKGMSVEEFREWREKLIEEKRRKERSARK